mmetsp:Transcript_83076/g.238707  ORF Transcript_83076/g.238707 Transcript_83076/m.238707 type:complete len:361 (+) Transcript_83076:695-1777(+)
MLLSAPSKCCCAAFSRSRCPQRAPSSRAVSLTSPAPNASFIFRAFSSERCAMRRCRISRKTSPSSCRQAATSADGPLPSSFCDRSKLSCRYCLAAERSPPSRQTTPRSCNAAATPRDLTPTAPRRRTSFSSSSCRAMTSFPASASRVSKSVSSMLSINSDCDRLLNTDATASLSGWKEQSEQSSTQNAQIPEGPFPRTWTIPLSDRRHTMARDITSIAARAALCRMPMQLQAFDACGRPSSRTAHFTRKPRGESSTPTPSFGRPRSSPSGWSAGHLSVEVCWANSWNSSWNSALRALIPRMRCVIPPPSLTCACGASFCSSASGASMMQAPPEAEETSWRARFAMPWAYGTPHDLASSST